MEVTDELEDYSHRTIYDDFFREKKFITKYIRFFFYCTVCSSVTSLSHSSEEGKNLLGFDSKEVSLKFHFFYMFNVCHVLIQKRCYSNKFSAFLVLLQLHLLIS